MSVTKKCLNTLKLIKNEPQQKKRKSFSVQPRSGLQVVIEKEGNKCRYFEGIMKYPKGSQSNIHVHLGVVGENDPKLPDKQWKVGQEVRLQKDLNKLITTWDLIKDWSKETGKHPNDYFKKDEIKKSDLTLKDLFDEYLDYYKHKVCEVTFKDRKNKFNQILRFFGDDNCLSDFEWDNDGRKRILTLIKSLKNNGKHYHATRIRNLLYQCFKYGISTGTFKRGQNPCEEIFEIESVGYEPKNNPAIHWDEVPELMNVINTSKSSVLTKSSIKLYLLSCIRVSVIVGMKWDWIDEEQNLIVVPPDTTGLKRKLSRKRNNEYVHYIPITEEIKTLLNQLRGINGHTEYVFYSQNQKKYPHQHPETINRFLHRNGYKDRLTAQGWRRVVVTSGTEIGGFNRDIIQRQIGQTEHRQGAIGCYDKSQFLDKRREFMNWWSKELVNQGLKI